MNRTYAVVWSDNGHPVSGRLDLFGDRLELDGREQRLSLLFAEVLGAAIARGRTDRLRGLPVLELARRSGAPVRIASLEGTAALHELFDQVERAGVIARSAA
jgi:hypothetical protein